MPLCWHSNANWTYARIFCLFFCQISPIQYSVSIYRNLFATIWLEAIYLAASFRTEQQLNADEYWYNSAKGKFHTIAARLCSLLLCVKFLQSLRETVAVRNSAKSAATALTAYANRINNIFVCKKAEHIYARLQILKSIWLSRNVAWLPKRTFLVETVILTIIEI